MTKAEIFFDLLFDFVDCDEPPDEWPEFREYDDDDFDLEEDVRDFEEDQRCNCCCCERVQRGIL